MKVLPSTASSLWHLQVGASPRLRSKQRLTECEASGDPRNVFETISALPEAFAGSLSIQVNDMDLDVTLRNAMMFLLLTHEDVDLAVDSILHLWYSSSLRPEHVMLLNTVVKTVVADVVAKTQDKSHGVLLSKSLAFGAGTLRIVLLKAEWTLFLQMLNRRLDPETSSTSRKAIVLHRKDYIELGLYTFRNEPSQRLAVQRFQNRGILLPFGYDDNDFTIPNLYVLNVH